jgi:AmmeMemoRadiSam system protein A
MTSDRDRRRLLDVARSALIHHVSARRPAGTDPDTQARQAAAFVSLHVRGELRGCIGRLEPDAPLWQVIAECARAAATKDPRFSPLVEAELADVEIEISILGPCEPIRSPDDIEIGRHGLLVEQGPRRGLLLPQVATAWRWTARTFLEQTCRKAGLPADSWQHGAVLWRFEAEVFGEAARPTSPDDR